MSRAELYLALCLIDAIEDGNLEAMGLLLSKHKANPNTMLLEKDVAPMHLIVGAENIAFAEKATELMLQHDGDPNLPTVDQQLTPLHAAASIGRVGVVRLLLAAGGNVEQLDEDDRTPIQHAIEEGHFAVVRLIQDHVFEKKIEHKRKQLLLEQQQPNHISEQAALSPIMRHMKSYTGFLPATQSTRLQASSVSALQQLEERTLTPNKIHYNFDVTSPYYVNITHRRKDRHKPLKNGSVMQELFPGAPSPDQENFTPVHQTAQQEQEQHDETKEDEGTIVIDDVATKKRTNLFELTERNLENFTRNDESIGRRNSFIESWREKIADIRDRSSVSRRLDDIDRILNSFSESKADFMKSFMEELEETFVTAAEHAPEETVIVQLSEEFLHTDDEAGVVFREKKMTTAPKFAMPAPPPRVLVGPIPKLQVISEQGSLIFEQSTEASTRRKEPPAVTRNQSLTSQSTAVTLPPMDYDTDALRAELTNYGEPPGPITKHTKKLYLRKLIKFRRHPERMAVVNTKGPQAVPNYSVELMATIRKEDSFKSILDHQCLEHEMTSEFLSSSSTKAVRNFREGHLKKSFIYLLLDPRISDNLPAQQKHLPAHELWRRFLASIFYVGKGKSSRPYSHLYDAMKLYHQRDSAGSTREDGQSCSDNDGNQHAAANAGGNLMIEEEQIIFQCTDDQQRSQSAGGGERHIRRYCQMLSSKSVNRTQLAMDSQKLNRIIDVWCTGKGVVCLHVFHNIMPAEAYTREAAIIDALGLQTLTNQKRGDYYGQSVSWPMKKRKQLGILLLYKAMLIFLAEGETQLLPSDLI